MSGLVVVVGSDALEEAISAAKARMPFGANSGKLATTLDAGLMGRLEQAMEEVENHLRSTWRDVATEATLVYAELKALVQPVVDSAGEKAQKVADLLIGRIRTLVDGCVSAALKRVPTTLVVGELHYRLDGVSVSHQLSLSGSLDASLTQLAELACGTEIQLETSYKLVESK